MTVVYLDTPNGTETLVSFMWISDQYGTSTVAWFGPLLSSTSPTAWCAEPMAATQTPHDAHADAVGALAASQPGAGALGSVLRSRMRVSQLPQ